MGVHWGLAIPHEAAITFPNERCIEVPLGYEAAECHQPGWVLDAGCGLNRHMEKAHTEAHVVHLTQNLKTESKALGSGRRSYMEADLRNLRIFANGAFERTVCLSTLEHVGMNNTTYGGPAEADPDSMYAALHELCRVTDRALMITVPFHDKPYACPEWRYMTPVDLAAMQTVIAGHGFRCETRFYAKDDEDKWYGGELQPIAGTLHDFPGRVNAFAAMRCLRER